MLQVLIFLAGLQYGSDVRDLGHSEFVVRDAAFRRLAAAGWMAVPSLIDVRPARGFPHTPNIDTFVSNRRPYYSDVERNFRLQSLRDRLHVPFGKWLSPVLLQCPLQGPFDPVMADYLWTLRHELCWWIDRRGLFRNDVKSLHWAGLKPYLAGSEKGDFLVVLQEARLNLILRGDDK